MTLFEIDERTEAIAAADGIVDLFGGPGGWDVALQAFGLRAVGVEYDRWACATRRAAGHPTVEADVAHQHPADYAPCTGFIASPPCQALSTAGLKHGRVYIDALVAAIGRADWHARPHHGVVNAADYGAPQIRQRAILIASRTRTVGPPVATHARDGVAGLVPWVTMADALGWTEGRVGFARRDDRGDLPDGYRERDLRGVDEPAFVVTEKARSWTVRTGQNSAMGGGTTVPYERDVERPSSTITSQARSWQVDTGRDWRTDPETGEALAFTGKAGGQWHITELGTELPDELDDRELMLWPWERPATTIAGDDGRVFHPGSHRANDGRNNDRAIGRSEHVIRIEIDDALILQSFPPDYPVQGGRTKAFEQIGNAIPPAMAHAVLAVVLG